MIDSTHDIDEARKIQVVKEYLVRLSEIREWLAKLLPEEEFPDVSDLEDFLTDGVVIAKLAALLSRDKSRRFVIFDPKHLALSRNEPLSFRHTDNINMFFMFVNSISFPKVFIFETVSLFEKKNLPGVIYCLYALSMFLYKRGFNTPMISNLSGKMQFSEEQILKVKTALDSYNLQLPKFNTIGGILATELSDDLAAMHAAIVLINQELDTESHNGLFAKLSDPAASLIRLDESLTQRYYTLLKEMRISKINLANQMQKPEAESDVYDRMLSQTEIQSYISQVNLNNVLVELTEAVKNNDEKKVLSFLHHPECSGIEVIDAYSSLYIQKLKEILESRKSDLLIHDDVCSAICSSNTTGQRYSRIDKLISTLKSQFSSGCDCDEIMHTLSQHSDVLPKVDLTNGKLYYVVLKESLQKSSGRDAFLSTLSLLCPLSRLNFAAENANVPEFMKYLRSPEIKISRLEDSFELEYITRVTEVQKAKKDALPSASMQFTYHLTHSELEMAIVEVHARSELIAKLESGSLDTETLWKLLSRTESQFVNLKAENKTIYLEKLLNRAKALKADDDSQLTLYHDEIQTLIDIANQHSSEGRDLATRIEEIHSLLSSGSVSSDKSQTIYKLLGESKIVGVLNECGEKYSKTLAESFAIRDQTIWNGWCEHSLPSNSQSFYFNHRTKELCFHNSPTIIPGAGYLNRGDIQSICSKVTASHNLDRYYAANTSSICFIQGFLSAYRLSRVLMDRPRVLKIRSFIHTYHVAHKHQQRLSTLTKNYPAVRVALIYLQAAIRMKQTTDIISVIEKNVSWVIRLQSIIRAEIAFNDYTSLAQSERPSIATLSKFVRFFEMDAKDLRDEKSISSLASAIEKLSNEISKHNKSCELYESTLAFVTENRVTSQQLARQRSKLFFRKKRGQQNYAGQESLERDRLLKCCGQLFHIIKNYPQYTSSLFVIENLNNTRKKVLTVCTRLFDDCARLKDEYAMVNFMDEVLKRLISSLETCDQFLKSNFPVIDVLAEYWRQRALNTWLKESLFKMANEFYNDMTVVSLHIKTGDLLSFTASQIQTTLGNDANPTQAEIADKCRRNAILHFSFLKKNIHLFIEGIFSHINKTPYPVRAFAKSITTYMKEKFPGPENEKEINKILAHFIFSKFYAPILTNPSSIDVSVKNQSMYASKVLSISSLITIISSTKDEDISHEGIAMKDDYEELLMNIRQSLNSFVADIVNVKSIEETYASVIGFPDQFEVKNSEWEMNAGDVCLLYDMLKELPPTADPSKDLLTMVLNSFEICPTPFSFFPKSMQISEEDAKNTLLRIKLVHVPDPELEEKRKTEELLANTKKIIIDILNVVQGENLIQILSTNFTSEHDKLYKELLESRKVLLKSISMKVNRSQSVSADISEDESLEQSAAKNPFFSTSFSSIHDARNECMKNIEMLISKGIITDSDDLADMVTMLAKDMKTLRLVRKARADDLIRMRDTVDMMQKKRDALRLKEDGLEKILEEIAGSSGRTYVKKTVTKKLEFWISKGILRSKVSPTSSATITSKMANVALTRETNGCFTVEVSMAGKSLMREEFTLSKLSQFQALNTTTIEIGDYLLNVNYLLCFIHKNFTM